MSPRIKALLTVLLLMALSAACVPAPPKYNAIQYVSYTEPKNGNPGYLYYKIPERFCMTARDANDKKVYFTVMAGVRLYEAYWDDDYGYDSFYNPVFYGNDVNGKRLFTYIFPRHWSIVGFENLIEQGVRGKTCAQLGHSTSTPQIGKNGVTYK